MPNLSGKYNRDTVQVEEALNRIQAHVRVLETETVPLAQASGRRVAARIAAPHPYPAFRRSGMDGYAVRAADLAAASRDTPVVLEVVEHIPCGCVPERPVASGQTSRIMTGAMLPEGADTVVMFEMTETIERDGAACISVMKPLVSGTNVSGIGSEVGEAELLLEEGRVIGAGETALLAVFGITEVPVYRRPTIAILSTGSELLPADAPLEPGKIRNSNAWMLAERVRALGGIPLVLETAADELEHVRAAILEALAQADAVITSGGVSVGDYDVLADWLVSWEGTTLFTKVAMRPGSPTSAGVLYGKLIFALSGNPGACFVGFELFVRPALAAMQGTAGPALQRIRALLGEGFPKVNNYPRYVRGTLSFAEGRVYAVTHRHNQSGSLISIKDTTALIVIPAGGSGLQPGDLVDVLLLG